MRYSINWVYKNGEHDSVIADCANLRDLYIKDMVKNFPEINYISYSKILKNGEYTMRKVVKED